MSLGHAGICLELVSLSSRFTWGLSTNDCACELLKSESLTQLSSRVEDFENVKKDYVD